MMYGHLKIIKETVIFNDRCSHLPGRAGKVDWKTMEKLWGQRLLQASKKSGLKSIRSPLPGETIF